MTVRQLAKELGLSKSTVSYALQGKPCVKEATRDRVLARARELNYEPNPLTSAMLRQVRARSVPRVSANMAVLLDHEGEIRNALIFRILAGIHDRAKESGLIVDEFNTRNVPSKTIMRILTSRGIGAVAVLPLLRSLGHRTLDWSKFASVSFGYSMARPALHRVVPNHLHAIRTAFRVCRKKGIRRIGMVLNNRSDSRSNGLWTAAFSQLQLATPRSQRVEMLLLSDQQLTPREITKWAKRERPEAVILHVPNRGARLPEVLTELPQPAIPVFLDTHRGSPYAGIDQEYERLGMAMVDCLLRQLILNERGVPTHPTLTMLDGTWVENDQKLHAGAAGGSVASIG